ncbi:exodeoxyribonuclease 7 large subunit [Oxobacter pfennigii]|uniref:Exodeoxyribonuclease 7 large subunit n=1 Tax=Oxobacter pfennigii TaxID=36849 RepID=A0A0P8W897_9CLOT|nr:exodeoxyribonuclease VII large subunit [Oxobacter pfennigii]KPU44911.1 exodeoxyribonuclease 7 large subunit [Oxobacter pfennigii]
MNVKVLSVSQITEYIKKVMAVDPILNNVSIRGEISNFKHHYSGHMYFTLKDENAKIKCVMFKSAGYNLKFLPEDGMNVIASGNISLYEKDGQYQLYINRLEPDGKGALFVAYEQLKKRLEAEGLFDKKRKKALPKYPSKVGVITSSTGAAVRDIINVMTRRFPGIHILVVPVLVQGEEAPRDITNAVDYLNTREDIDVIIVGRGGGSIEELWAFNDEFVARAITRSKIPVISAVGHETDFTISDFVSDLRAPTPSAAAEVSVPDKRELKYRLDTYINNIKSLILKNLNEDRALIDRYKSILNTLSPAIFLNQKRQYIDTLNFKLDTAMKRNLDMAKDQFRNFCTNLESLNPLSTLSRGYSICLNPDSKEVIDSIEKVSLKDNVEILVKNGSIECEVTGLSKGSVVIENTEK